MTSVDADTVQEQIVLAGRRFAQAIRDRDLDSLAALFADDIILLPANKPVEIGAAAALAYWDRMTGDSHRRLHSEFTPLDVDLVAADCAIEVGRAKISAEIDGALHTLDHGKYLAVWKRIEGRWKMHRDIFNSDGGPDHQ